MGVKYVVPGVATSNSTSLALNTIVFSAWSLVQFLPNLILVDLSTVGKFLTI
jgi:hypothetical protein